MTPDINFFRPIHVSQDDFTEALEMLDRLVPPQGPLPVRRGDPITAIPA